MTGRDARHSNTDGVYAFLAEHRGELFPDSFIADLFSAKTGRPSLPADLEVLVLKELLDMSDPQSNDGLVGAPPAPFPPVVQSAPS